MTDKEILLPVPVENSNQPLLINSFNLTEYLAQNPHYIGRNVLLAPYFHIPWLRRISEELLNYQILSYLISDEERANAEKVIDKSESNPFFSEETKNTFGKMRRMYTQKSPAERSRLVFVDLKTGTIMTTQPSSSGKFGETQREISQIIDEGDPLIEIHTHPITSPQSFSDYQTLIVNSPSYNYQTRVVPASLVLCPKLQILAIATPQTPFMNPEQANGLIHDLEQSIENDEKVNKLTEKLNNILSLNIRYLSKRYKEIIDYADRLKEAGLSQEEIETKLNKRMAEQQKEKDKFFERIYKLYDTVDQRFFEQLNGNSISALIQAARDWNIKLYISQDMEHFQKFSA